MGKQIANMITGCRILCSIFMIGFPVDSAGFFVLYLVCGFSDMVDGTVARKTNSVSEFGARLDTVSDFLFAAVALMKILPILHLSEWLWIWVAGIMVLKISNVILGFVYRKKFVSLHTILNKMTGLFLFLLPLTLRIIDLEYSAAAVCFLATVSAIQEGYYIGKGYESV